MDNKCFRNCKRLVQDMRAVAEEGDSFHENGTKSTDMDEVSSKRRRSSGTTSSLSNVPSAVNLNYVNISSNPAASTTSLVKTIVHHQSTSVVTNGFRSTDLKLGDSETESSTFTIADFRETSTASSEFCCQDLGEVMESSSIKNAKPSSKDTQRKYSAAKLPSAEQIEEFFSAAEKHQQKRFAEKYNYDVVKDVPLEGRYQWVRLKP